MSNPKFMYKGTDINSIITSGSSSVNTGITTSAYSGFPSYNPSNTNVDLDKVKNLLLYQISNTDIVSKSNIQAASYKTVDKNESYPIPAWCNGVKFYISSAKGSSGTAGNKGDTGAQGAQGAKGANGLAKNCPEPFGNEKRPRDGASGGPGGAGGDGGPGGTAGEGGAGVYFYSTSLIPVTAGSSVSIDTTSNMSLKISDSNYSANKGQSGTDGSKGNKGEPGGQGNQGGPGGNNCNSDRTSKANGNTGVKGAAGKQGASGNKGSDGSVSSPTTVTQGTNTTDSKEITIYFFATT